MPDLPKSVIGRMQAQAAPRQHPDADLLAAFSEQALTGRERETVLAHLAQCAACREAVALASPPAAEAQPGALLVPWFRRPQIFAWVGSLATLAVVGALILNYGQVQQPAKTVSDVAPAKISGTSAPENKPAAPAKSDATNGSVGALRKDETAQRSATAAKEELKRKQGSDELHAARDMTAPAAVASAPQLAPGKDQKTLDGGMLQDQYRVMNKQAAPAPPSAAANAVSETAQISDSAQDVSIQSAASERTRKKAEAAGEAGAAGGVLYQSRAAKLAMAPAMRWSLSDKGRLQRSADSGRTWQPVLANETTVFRAVAAVGNQVWAGGSAAALFHSADAGATWAKQALPGASSDVVALQFSDATHGTARTSDGASWSTSDGGQHWARP